MGLPNKGPIGAELRIFRLSQAARYALQGTIALARLPEGRYQLAEGLARRHRLPANFLAKVMQRLATRGLLRGRRGPGGGYALARPASGIALSEIVGAVERPQRGGRLCMIKPGPCLEDHPCALHRHYLRAERQLRRALDQITLADMARLH